MFHSLNCANLVQAHKSIGKMGNSAMIMAKGSNYILFKSCLMPNHGWQNFTFIKIKLKCDHNL